MGPAAQATPIQHVWNKETLVGKKEGEALYEAVKHALMSTKEYKLTTFVGIKHMFDELVRKLNPGTKSKKLKKTIETNQFGFFTFLQDKTSKINKRLRIENF